MVLLTEDASLDLVSSLLSASGFELTEVEIYSYKTSSNIQAALALSEFIGEIAPATHVIIHRDRDFMTEQEVEWVSDQIASAGATPYITEGSDVEAHFTGTQHLAACLNVPQTDVEEWKDIIASDSHNELMHKFTRKRDDAKILYRNRDEDPPNTLTLVGNANPLPEYQRHGKSMLSKIRGDMHAQFGVTVDLLTPTDFLASERLVEVLLANEE